VSEDFNDISHASPEKHPEQAITGVVKWFDPAKGFGFVIADSGGADILLHVNVLRNFGQSSVADGAVITLEAQRTDRGVQATRILDIRPPAGVHANMLPDIGELDPEEVARMPLLPARVKWFDKGKGFGFANVFGKSEDIFLHVEVLRQSGLSDLQPGEALALRIVKGKRGNLAAEVQPWEAANTQDEDGAP
jgi:CspA family cold shock protein